MFLVWTDSTLQRAWTSGHLKWNLETDFDFKWIEHQDKEIT